MADKNIMSYETVALDEENHALVIIDQTKLPGEVEILHLTEQKDIWQAIYLLQVRGAPAIGVAAGFGLYLAARQIQAEDFDGFYRQLHEAKEYLNSSRPTAVNLSWALNRMEQVALDNRDKPVAEIKELLRRASRETEAPALQRQVDRMAVQQDLRRLSWERDFDDCAAHLQRMMTLLRDFLALPRESQQLQLDTFRDAGIEEISQAENFLSRQRG